jgi:hypothetical protein
LKATLVLVAAALSFLAWRAAELLRLYPPHEVAERLVGPLLVVLIVAVALCVAAWNGIRVGRWVAILAIYEFWLWLVLCVLGRIEDFSNDGSGTWLILAVAAPVGAIITAMLLRWTARPP